MEKVWILPSTEVIAKHECGLYFVFTDNDIMSRIALKQPLLVLEKSNLSAYGLPERPCLTLRGTYWVNKRGRRCFAQDPKGFHDFIMFTWRDFEPVHEPEYHFFNVDKDLMLGYAVLDYNYKRLWNTLEN